MWDQGVDLDLDSCQTVTMIHSPVGVVLLPWMMSFIYFSYWLTAAPPRSAFSRLRVHTLLTPVNVIIHTLHTYCTLYTHHKHTRLEVFLTLLFTGSLSHVTPLLSPSLLPQPPTPLFSLRMGTRRLRSFSTATT